MTTPLRIELLKLEDVDDNPEYNVRTRIGDITDLTASIMVHGVKEPVIVKKHSKREGFRLIAGFRRVAASRLAGVDEIPARIEPQKTTSAQMTLVGLIENVQREDLPPLDEGTAYHKLIKGGMSLVDLCSGVGKSRTYVESRIALLQLGDIVKEALGEQRIGVTAAREIARLPEEYHPKFVVVAEEFAVTKLRDKVDKELTRIDRRANPALPGTPQATDNAAQERLEALRSSVLDELGDMASRYAEAQIPHLHVVDLSQLEEPTLRVLLVVMQGCRASLHQDDTIIEVDFTAPDVTDEYGNALDNDAGLGED